MSIAGTKVVLRPAEAVDREKTYRWLTQSDLTSSMMGGSDFSDHPVPSWEEYCGDYTLEFFTSVGDGKGRVYIILANEEEVGTVSYDLLDMAYNRVVLDIWLRSEADCGQGYGSEALAVLCTHIHRQFGITRFIISPSARNKRAVAAYHKAGFVIEKTLNKTEQIEQFGLAEYDDNLLMIKQL